MQELLSVFDSMDTLASQVASNTELLNFFIPLQDDETPENYFRAHLMDSIRAGSLLATINSTDRRACASACSTNTATTSAPARSTRRMKRSPPRWAAATPLPKWSAKLGAGGGVVVSGPHADYWSDNESVRLFSLVRPLSTLVQFQVYGYISVQQSVDVLHSLSLWIGATALPTCCSTRRARTLRPRVGPPCPKRCLADLPAPGESAEYALDMDGGMIVFAMRDPFSGWTLVRLLPASLLDTPYQQVYLLILLVGLGLLAILLVVVYLLATGSRARCASFPRASSASVWTTSQRYTPAFQFLHGGIAGPGPHLPRHAAQAQPVHRL